LQEPYGASTIYYARPVIHTKTKYSIATSALSYLLAETNLEAESSSGGTTTVY
jgi:hypothetical protein